MRLRMMAAGVLVGLAIGCEPGPSEPPVLDPQAIAENNRGVGLMGHFQYQKAYDTFFDLVERYPDHPDLRVNLAISQLNLQTEADELGALAHLDRVLADHPQHLRALYVSGILKTYRGETEAALDRFRSVAQADPADAYAAYYTGQGLAQLGRNEEALDWFARSLAEDPYLRSAAYGASQAARRLERPEADDYLDVFQRLADNPRGQLAEIKYTRMGPKANAIVLGKASPAPLPDGASAWAPFETLAMLEAARFGPSASLNACDIDLDGRVDLVVCGVLKGETDDTSNGVLWNRESGWTLDDAIPWLRRSDVITTLWGDVDGNGWPDVFLCREGVNELWMQREGVWTRDDAISAADGSALRTVDGALFDADHDGDLDIFSVNADGPNVLLNNNRDGSWRIVGAEEGLPSPNRASRQVLVADLDRDRDLDLVIINESPPHEVYVNDRLWRYEAAPDLETFCQTPMNAAVAGDLDADGGVDLVSLHGDGNLTLWNAGTEWGPQPLEFAPDAATPSSPASPREVDHQIALIDVGGNGQRSMVWAASGGVMIANLGADGTSLVDADRLPMPGVKRWTPVAIDPRRGYALAALVEQTPEDGAGTVAAIGAQMPGSGRYPFVAVSFTGKQDQGQSMRSNASGIGTSFAARSGRRWTMGRVLRDDSGPGQGLQPALIGLGPASQLDFLAINWSDGVFQTELAVDGEVVIEETQRQLSSCPVLFVETGDGMTFVSDLLGVGGIGFRSGRDTVVTPRPWERFLIPDHLFPANASSLRLAIAEPMEESCYLDAVSLTCWDLPEDWSMTLDERMGTGMPKPTGEPVFYRQRIRPTRVSNASGDVTAAAEAADQTAIPIPPRDPRFLGRLAEDHVIEMCFDHPLDALDGEPVLVLDGWVEYPYSQTCFAAWQANATYDPPSIEARGPDGSWFMVAERIGYPAGMPRQMSVPLGSLPPGTAELRIRSNLEIYWDSIAVVGSLPCPQARSHALEPISATLAEVGYPRRRNGAQRQPDFDWNDRAPLWDTRFQRGYYTRRGAVDRLLAEADAAVAIFGPGEAVECTFAGPPSLPRGHRRFFVLGIEGWCKDKDLFTQDGDTLEPLPGHPDERAQQLNETHNIRWMGGS